MPDELGDQVVAVLSDFVELLNVDHVVFDVKVLAVNDPRDSQHEGSHHRHVYLLRTAQNRGLQFLSYFTVILFRFAGKVLQNVLVQVEFDHLLLE